MIIKTILTWLWTQIRKELTIQVTDKQFERANEIVNSNDKPTDALIALMRMQASAQPKQETRQERIFKNGINGFAMILLICVGVAVLVF